MRYRLVPDASTTGERQVQVGPPGGRFYLAVLNQLGIDEGGPVEPDDRLVRIRTQASVAEQLMAQAPPSSNG